MIPDPNEVPAVENIPREQVIAELERERLRTEDKARALVAFHARVFRARGENPVRLVYSRPSGPEQFDDCA
jgi:hypothetical protein